MTDSDRIVERGLPCRTGAAWASRVERLVTSTLPGFRQVRGNFVDHVENPPLGVDPVPVRSTFP